MGIENIMYFALGLLIASLVALAVMPAVWGRAVRLTDGTEGTAEGVDAQGALRVRTAQGLRTVHSAEVSVRPC